MLTRLQDFGSAKDLSMGNLSFQLSRQSNRSLPQAFVFNARSFGELDERLAAFERNDNSVPIIHPQPARPVILCFGGQISTYVGLDKNMYDRVAILKAYLDQCNTTCISLGLESIYPDIFQRSTIQDIVKLHTALFATQYSCAKAWIDCGVEVAAIVGHSFGELTALCVSGVLSLEDAVKLVSGRALLIRDDWSPDGGSMLAVEADIAAVNALLAKSRTACKGKAGLSIACYNGPTTFTLAGPTEAVQLAADLAKNDPIFSNVKIKKLNVTNAYHSALVDPVISGLDKLGQQINFNEPAIRLELATEYKATEKLEAGFVAKHMRNPVYFHHAVQRLVKEFPSAIWLEAGSNSTVTNMASRALGRNSSSAHFQPINITSEGSWQFLVDATTKLWKEGLNVSFWTHHTSQVSEYAPMILPPYQFERSRHWMELKSPPKLQAPIVEQGPLVEIPKGLTTFIGYQDKDNRAARFRVNTSIDKFQRSLLANIVAQTTAVTPGMLQLEVALDALMSLRSDFKDFSFQPELQGMTHHKVFTVDPSRTVYLDAISSDDGGLIWEWKLNEIDTKGAITVYTTGTTVFRAVGDSQLQDTFQRLSRLSGRKRCVSLLEGNHADEVLQGRNIYRAFEQVVDYKEPFRHVTKIVSSVQALIGPPAKNTHRSTCIHLLRISISRSFDSYKLFLHSFNKPINQS